MSPDGCARILWKVLKDRGIIKDRRVYHDDVEVNGCLVDAMNDKGWDSYQQLLSNELKREEAVVLLEFLHKHAPVRIQSDLYAVRSHLG